MKFSAAGSGRDPVACESNSFASGPTSTASTERRLEHGMAYDKIHRDEFETNGNWSLARKSLGIESFGINIVSIDAGDQIPEHNEAGRDHEVVFIVLSGSPSMVIDGEEFPIETGTFVRVDLEHERTVRNTGEIVSDVLIVSAPRSSGYTAMSWA